MNRSRVWVGKEKKRKKKGNPNTAQQSNRAEESNK
jgi:hypothetical protein